MGKRMVVPKYAPSVVHAKKPCPKKDGAVARRVGKGHLKIEAKKETKVKEQSSRVSNPTRLNWVGSKKRKRDADKKYRHSLLSLLPISGEFAEVDELRGDFCVDSEIRDMRADSCNDQITGDDSLSERFGGGRYEY